MDNSNPLDANDNTTKAAASPAPRQENNSPNQALAENYEGAEPMEVDGEEQQEDSDNNSDSKPAAAAAAAAPKMYRPIKRARTAYFIFRDDMKGKINEEVRAESYINLFWRYFSTARHFPFLFELPATRA